MLNNGLFDVLYGEWYRSLSACSAADLKKKRKKRGKYQCFLVSQIPHRNICNKHIPFTPSSPFFFVLFQGMSFFYIFILFHSPKIQSEKHLRKMAFTFFLIRKYVITISFDQQIWVNMSLKLFIWHWTVFLLMGSECLKWYCPSMCFDGWFCFVFLCLQSPCISVCFFLLKKILWCL